MFSTKELPLPFAVAGKDLLTVEWPVRFEQPKPIVFQAPPERQVTDLWVRVLAGC